MQRYAEKEDNEACREMIEDMVGENVMLVVQRYNEEKLQMFGKILSKW